MATIPEDVEAFIAGVKPAGRQRDARILLELMGRATGQAPQLRGSIVSFGDYHYTYASGHEGDTCAAGFAPRKAASTIYLLDGIHRYDDELAKLGPHRTGVGCLYLTDLTRIDLDVLEGIVTRSFARLTEDTYRQRARD